MQILRANWDSSLPIPLVNDKSLKPTETPSFNLNTLTNYDYPGDFVMNLLDFFIENEKLRSEWAEDLNTEDPSKLQRNSREKVWWRCEKGHSWQTQVISRTMNGSSCPYCSGRKAIPGETDLATKHPDIARQWDYEKNGDLDPQNITPGSAKKVWWSCEKGHSWQAMVYSRATGGNGCPYCSGYNVIPGKTDLATLRPDIARQWDYEKNLDIVPQNVAVRSRRKVWWRCEKGHSWQVEVYIRTHNGRGCPVCSGEGRGAKKLHKDSL